MADKGDRVVPWRSILPFLCPKGCSWGAQPVTPEARRVLEEHGRWCMACATPMKLIRII